MYCSNATVFIWLKMNYLMVTIVWNWGFRNKSNYLSRRNSSFLIARGNRRIRGDWTLVFGMEIAFWNQITLRYYLQWLFPFKIDITYFDVGFWCPGAPNTATTKNETTNVHDLLFAESEQQTHPPDISVWRSFHVDVRGYMLLEFTKNRIFS